MSFDWILSSGPIAMFVLALLVMFSVVSWAIIIVKYTSFRRALRSSLEFVDLFWKVRRFDEVFEASDRFRDSPVAEVFRKGYQEFLQVKKDPKSTGDISAMGVESIEHALRRTYISQMKELESLIPFLATVGSTSPFIGLFGTVVGIMNSFQQIGMKGSASLSTVAPGIAEALIATAAGLLAAIPAVIAYNYFSVRLRGLSVEIESFSSDFINIVRRHVN